MTVYSDWPTLDELKQVLDVTSEDWDGDLDGTRLTAVLESAIEHVKRETGFTDYEDFPSVGQSRAALRMAELMALRPDSSAQFEAQVGQSDQAYKNHLYGEHKRWGIG